MYLKTLNLGNMDNNCYIIADLQTKEAAIIDAPSNASAILDALEEENLRLKYVLLTHTHFDHTSALDEVYKATGAKVVLHTFEKDCLNNADDSLASYEGLQPPSKKADLTLQDKDILRLGRYEIIAIYTPGHTVGGMSYLVEDKLFSGDTLFLNDVGRCDFPGGNYDVLKKSVQSQLYILPDKTEVYPGHGLPTTIGHEKHRNNYVRQEWE